MLNMRKRKAMMLKSYAINQAYFISKRFSVQTLIRAELSIISKWGVGNTKIHICSKYNYAYTTRHTYK